MADEPPAQNRDALDSTKLFVVKNAPGDTCSAEGSLAIVMLLNSLVQVRCVPHILSTRLKT